MSDTSSKSKKPEAKKPAAPARLVVVYRGPSQSLEASGVVFIQGVPQEVDREVVEAVRQAMPPTGPPSERHILEEVAEEAAGAAQGDQEAEKPAGATS